MVSVWDGDVGSVRAMRSRTCARRARVKDSRARWMARIISARRVKAGEVMMAWSSSTVRAWRVQSSMTEMGSAMRSCRSSLVICACVMGLNVRTRRGSSRGDGRMYTKQRTDRVMRVRFWLNAKIAKGSKRGLNAEDAKVTQRSQRRGGEGWHAYAASKMWFMHVFVCEEPAQAAREQGTRHPARARSVRAADCSCHRKGDLIG